MNRSKILQIIVLGATFFLAAGVDNARASNSEPTSGVEGSISTSPIQAGPTREGTPDSAPLSNITLTVERQGKVVCSVKTDREGRFHIPLPPGRYKISVQNQKRGIGRCGPFEVEIAVGEMKQVRWDCDTGIR
jgi:hypothetical protein